MKYVALLAASQLADLLSTWFAISHGATEMNPIAKAALNYGGYAMFFSFKMVVVALGFFIVYRAARFGARYLRNVHRIVLVLALIAFAVAAWNMVAWI